MRSAKYTILIPYLLACISCVPVNKIARHDFDSGFFSLKTDNGEKSQVYLSVKDDSIDVFPIPSGNKTGNPDISSIKSASINKIIPGDYFYKSCFVKNSVDVDLSTIIAKFRPAKGDVPSQLSSNINAALYMGLRRDFYKSIPYKTPLNENYSFIRQTAFDAGFFAGFGITPINPSVTSGNVSLEYDGIVFQKGIAGFITFDNISIGVTLGFDSLLDKNRNVWLFNEKPYLGIMIGVSNF